MPTYEYRCSGCQAFYERREGFDAPAVHPCERCGAEARRVLRPPAIVFKGAGFYATDSRNGRPADGASEVESVTAGASDDDHGHSHGDDLD
ncbi:MAG TPA: FmdB family zinc ribbon protein [Dehalococcoidia bacterium]|nr:FmdB family zinc ribbon protein [Dehalococcoidia bacterium]